MIDNENTIFDIAAEDGSTGTQAQDNASKAKLFGNAVLNQSEWQKVQREDPQFYYSADGKALRAQHQKSLGVMFYSKRKPNLAGLLKDLG